MDDTGKADNLGGDASEFAVTSDKAGRTPPRALQMLKS